MFARLCAFAHMVRRPCFVWASDIQTCFNHHRQRLVNEKTLNLTVNGLYIYISGGRRYQNQYNFLDSGIFRILENPNRIGTIEYSSS